MRWGLERTTCLSYERVQGKGGVSLMVFDFILVGVEMVCMEVIGYE